MDVYLEILIPIDIIRCLRRGGIGIDENMEVTDPVCKRVFIQNIRPVAIGRHSGSTVYAKISILLRYGTAYEIVSDAVGRSDYIERFVGVIRLSMIVKSPDPEGDELEVDITLSGVNTPLTLIKVAPSTSDWPKPYWNEFSGA